MQNDGVWAETVRRLDQRAHPKWDSLSWVALRPLISAINDRVNWVAPRLVLELRQRWLAQTVSQHGGPGDYIVDRSDVTSFIMLGDTGEQDASQYVVAPALEAAMNGTGDVTDGGTDGGVDDAGRQLPQFAIICSDVIYPSGDINDYVHGFYLPYENLLRRGEKQGKQRIYGLPGNHDWYDGLTGFMNTFVGDDELDATAYRWPDESTLPDDGPGSGTLRRRLHAEGIGRLLWRRPARPLAAPLHLGDRPQTPAQLRSVLAPTPANETAQPGPYFAIKVKGLLIVCIDGGIGIVASNCMIDANQGRWLIGLSQRYPGPKVLLTGYPLLVNGEWKLCIIDGAAEAKARGEWDGPTTVGELVATKEYGYIAAIGGDVHNFQHYEVPVGPDGHVVTYLVSGGGGAYISATHPVPTAAHYRAERSTADDEAIRAANAVRGGPPRPEDFAAAALDPESPADPAVAADPAHRILGPPPSTGPHEMIPSPSTSLSHFSDQVLPMTWRFIRLMMCLVAGGAAGAAIGEWAGDLAEPALWITLLVVAVAAVARALVPQLAPPRRTLRVGRGKLHTYRAGFAAIAALAGAGSALSAWQLDPDVARRYLGAWVVVTAVGAVLATLQRRSGWWREHGLEQRGPLFPGGRPRSTDLVTSSIIWGLVTLITAARALVSLFDVGPRIIWLGVGGAILVGVAIFGWIVRERSWWRGVSQTIALVAQLVAAFFVFTAVPGRHSALRPLGVLAGIALDVVLLVIALIVTTAGIVGLAKLTSRGGDWRATVGRWGFAAPPLISMILVVSLTVLSLLPRFTTVHTDAFADVARTAISAGWGLALLVLGVFTVDSLRRNFPASFRWIATPAFGLVAAVALWGQAQGMWLGTGLVLMTIGTLLLAISISAGYLAFLGGHNLLFDWPAHQDLEDRTGADGAELPLIPIPEAEKVLDWRQTSLGGEQLDPTIRTRAKFVFPSTDQPNGIIQQKVSEFFSTDRPPFFQHFLTFRVTDTALEITPQVVTGATPVPADTRPMISIPLGVLGSSMGYQTGQSGGEM